MIRRKLEPEIILGSQKAVLLISKAGLWGRRERAGRRSRKLWSEISIVKLKILEVEEPFIWVNFT